MATIEESIEVGVPVRTAYNQWTQFEEFPRFMDGVEQIRQLTDTKLHWEAKNAGDVTFHRIDEGKTRIMLQMDVEPEGVLEKAGDALGVVKRGAKGDLERFKELVESRGAETGAWRGEVRQDP